MRELLGTDTPTPCHSVATASLARAALIPVSARGYSSLSLSKSAPSTLQTPNFELLHSQHQPIAAVIDEVELVIRMDRSGIVELAGAITDLVGDTKLASEAPDAAATVSVDAKLAQDAINPLDKGIKPRLPPTHDFSGIPRDDFFTEFLSRTPGGDWHKRVDREKLAQLATMLPRRPMPRKKPIPTSQAQQPENPDDYLTWDEVGKLKQRILRAKYRDEREKLKLQQLNTPASTSGDLLSSVTLSPPLMTSSAPQALASEPPKSGAKKLRAPSPQRMHNRSSSVTISDSKLGSVETADTSKVPQQQWPIKKFRGHTSIPPQNDGWASQLPPGPLARTSSDPPLFDNRSLPPRAGTDNTAVLSAAPASVPSNSTPVALSPATPPAVHELSD